MKAALRTKAARGIAIAALAMVAGGFAAAQALDFPMSMAASPDGKYILVLNAGTQASISVMDASAIREIARVPLQDAWLGLTFAPGGKFVYAGGGSRGSVYEFSFSPDGVLKQTREMKASDFVGDVALSPDGRLIYTADLYNNSVTVINPRSGRVIDQFKTGRRPYKILFLPDGKSFFVSSWADAAVYQYSTANGGEIGRLRLGPHTTGMALSSYHPPAEEGEAASSWRYRLFVAAANTNDVFSVGIGENDQMRLDETIHVAPGPLSSLGMTPSAVALSPDQKSLYVVCSDAGVVARVDVSSARAALEGFLPVAPGVQAAKMYPIAIAVLRDGRAVAANGKGPSLVDLTGQEPRPLADVSIEMENPQVRASHVVYVLQSPAQRPDPEALMKAIAGLAPDYTVKLAPAFLAGRRKVFDFDAGEPANTPPAGYLWTNALAAGLTVRNYGVFVRDGKVTDPTLQPVTNLAFQGTPAERAKVFLDDWKQLDARGAVPNLVMVQMSDDAAAIALIVDGIKASRMGSTTQIVMGDLPAAESWLGLRPMTRSDRAPSNP